MPGTVNHDGSKWECWLITDLYRQIGHFAISYFILITGDGLHKCL
jgi:hypothetical protein